MFIAVVKGNRYEAANAASFHGVGFAFEREIIRPGYVTTVGIVGGMGNSTKDEIHRELQIWFLEDTHTPPPYEPGSLLLYRDEEEI